MKIEELPKNFITSTENYDIVCGYEAYLEEMRLLNEINENLKTNSRDMQIITRCLQELTLCITGKKVE